MQEHFHFTTDRAKIQKQYAAIFFFVSAQLSSIQMHLQRRNRHLVKQEDAVVIAIHILGKLLGFTSERAWHRFVTGNLFTNGSFLERSRYNRRCRALRFAIKWIRHSEQNAANIMPMPWSTACRSRCAIPPECIASNGFKRSPTSGIALPKSNGAMG
ncbi:transposase IS4 family protein [Geobacillus kaustophilus]|uniref:Transposase IS4 family protein n=1 Tax=Geobacillus kaustophilus TaxID=1462 RepID=A0A0D8BVC4_GEOKU|nr:transposase IS4 family protein [Geobacillus kaustophilus]KJE28476.1 transposase IS4 family protein [Geobacillus kaustophilus]